MSTLHEWWPDLPETVLDPPDTMFEEGCIWGLVGIGDTFSKSSCQAPCVCECTNLEGVWCPTRKDICVDCKWQYKHVTQLGIQYLYGSRCLRDLAVGACLHSTSP